MIIQGTDSPTYLRWREQQGITKNNGAYWYAKELEDIILPQLKDLSVCVNTVGTGLYDPNKIRSGTVILCHDNRTTLETYARLMGRGMYWVCSKHSVKETLEKAGEKAFYIPLSIDTSFVRKTAEGIKKHRTIAFVGNAWSFKEEYLRSLPKKIAKLSNMEREDLIREMAHYKTVIAEGRCLMEAKALGCDTQLPEYPNGLEVVDVEVLDSRDAIPLWREVLEQAPTFTRVVMKRDIYPYCLGDTVVLNSSELGRLNRLAEKRRIADPYDVL